jgi:hypothetical protein
MLGIRPDGVIELSDSLRKTKDGPTLKHGFLGFDGLSIHAPVRIADRPRPDYLAERYRQFLEAG